MAAMSANTEAVDFTAPPVYGVDELAGDPLPPTDVPLDPPLPLSPPPPVATSVQLPPATLAAAPFTRATVVPLLLFKLPEMPASTTLPEVPGGVWKL